METVLLSAAFTMILSLLIVFLDPETCGELEPSKYPVAHFCVQDKVEE